MKILHTADIHLNELQGKRWEALEQILNLGKKEDINCLVIAGDLFDKSLNAVQLRMDIEKLFSNYDFPILILPGNHDLQAFKNDPYWGENVQVFQSLDQPIKIQDVSFWGLPFQDLSERQIIRKLENLNKNLDKKSASHIFVYHGELVDTYYSGQSSSAFGDEGEKRYLPMKLSYFKNLKFNYVLAGHFHSKFDIRKIAKNKFFVYPGSPVSITKKEVGPRKVNIFKVGKPPQGQIIPTAFYSEINYQLNPFESQKPVQEIKQKLKELPKEAIPILSVKGFFDEKQLGKSKKTLSKELKNLGAEYQIQDVSQIINDELFNEFSRHLKKTNVEDKKKVQELVIQAMMEARVGS